METLSMNVKNFKYQRAIGIVTTAIISVLNSTTHAEDMPETTKPTESVVAAPSEEVPSALPNPAGINIVEDGSNIVFLNRITGHGVTPETIENELRIEMQKTQFARNKKSISSILYYALNLAITSSDPCQELATIKNEYVTVLRLNFQCNEQDDDKKLNRKSEIISLLNFAISYIEKYTDVAIKGITTTEDDAGCKLKNHAQYFNAVNKKKFKCESRLAGYVYAKMVKDDSGSCGFGLYKYDMKNRKPSSFISGYREWWDFWGNDKECKEPTVPIKCTLGTCWGKNFSTGITVRPSLNMGAAFGKGIGFDTDTFGFNAQLTTSVLFRFFVLEDMLDLRFGMGVGSILVQNTVESASAENGQETISKSTFFGLTTAGIGTFHGMIGFNAIICWNPFIEYDESVAGSKFWQKGGVGFSLYVDLASIQDIFGDQAAKKANSD